MILKKLELQNIRSYKEEVIVFSVGKTLFQGDIGSGKSTILMAIEFALFGLGDLNADALLKTHFFRRLNPLLQKQLCLPDHETTGPTSGVSASHSTDAQANPPN